MGQAQTLTIKPIPYNHITNELGVHSDNQNMGLDIFEFHKFPTKKQANMGAFPNKQKNSEIIQMF